MPDCPYHGDPKPCRKCLTANPRMGEFAHDRPGQCKPHGKANPCLDCFDAHVGEFAPAPVKPVPTIAVLPKLVHYHQTKKDTCAVACCAMVGRYFGCAHIGSMQDPLDALETYMTIRGVYIPGKSSGFDTLNYVFEWLGLECVFKKDIGPKDLKQFFSQGYVVVLEAKGHVLVVFSAGEDDGLVVGDPAMIRSIEVGVPTGDYRLQGTGRVWLVRPKQEGGGKEGKQENKELQKKA